MSSGRHRGDELDVVAGHRRPAGLRSVLLEQLSAEFAAELPDIEDATKDLADELQELENAVDVINAVAGALGVIASIVTLLA